MIYTYTVTGDLNLSAETSLFFSQIRGVFESVCMLAVCGL